jgi:hypothetical protein
MNSGDPKARTRRSGSRHKGIDGSPPRFQFIPKWRMNSQFPWPIWAVGWLAIFKGVIWLATDPSIPSPTAEMLAAKFLVCLVPYVLFGIGVWNFRRWAVWGLVVLSAADLLFFLTLGAYTPLYELLHYIAGKHFFVIQLLLLVFNGPLGNILLLVATPLLLKYSGRHLPPDIADAAMFNTD